MNSEVPSSVGVKIEEPEPESEVQQAVVDDSGYEFLGFLEEKPSAASTSTTVAATSAGRMRPEKMCPVCEQVFATVQSMQRHGQRKHPDRVAECLERGYKEGKRSLPFVCEACSKSFATLAYLQSHTRRMHTVGKRFPCEICQRAYPLVSELRKHVKRVHGLNGTVYIGEMDAANNVHLSLWI